MTQMIRISLINDTSPNNNDYVLLHYWFIAVKLLYLSLSPNDRMVGTNCVRVAFNEPPLFFLNP